MLYQEFYRYSAECKKWKRKYTKLQNELEDYERRVCASQGITDPVVIEQRIRYVQSNNAYLASYASKYEFNWKELQRVKSEIIVQHLAKEAFKVEENSEAPLASSGRYQ
jgi:hypothetical protein